MNRRLFVGTTGVASIGITAGLGFNNISLDVEKFRKIQKEELSKFRADLTSHLEGFDCKDNCILSLTTPVEILSEKLNRNKFYLKFRNANGDCISITRTKNKSFVKIGEHAA